MGSFIAGWLFFALIITDPGWFGTIPWWWLLIGGVLLALDILIMSVAIWAQIALRRANKEQYSVLAEAFHQYKTRRENVAAVKKGKARMRPVPSGIDILRGKAGDDGTT